MLPGTGGAAAAPREGREQGVCFPHHCITKMYYYQRQYSPTDQKTLVWSRVAFDNLSRHGWGAGESAKWPGLEKKVAKFATWCDFPVFVCPLLSAP